MNTYSFVLYRQFLITGISYDTDLDKHVWSIWHRLNWSSISQLCFEPSKVWVYYESCQVRLFIISLSSFVSIDTKIAVRASSFSPYFLQSWVPWQSKLDFLTMFIRKSLTVFTFNCNIKWVQIQWYFTTSYKMASGFQTTSVNLDLNLDANIFTITMQIIHFFVKTYCNRNYGNETVVSLQLNSLKVTK